MKCFGIIIIQCFQRLYFAIFFSSVFALKIHSLYFCHLHQLLKAIIFPLGNSRSLWSMIGHQPLQILLSGVLGPTETPLAIFPHTRDL